MFFFFSSRRRHTRYWRDWSSDVCSSDLSSIPPGGATLVTGGIDDTVRLWDTATGKELRRLRAHQYGSWSVAVSPDGRRVASAGSSPARVWDAADGKELHVLRGGTLAVAFAPDGKTVVTGRE